MKALVIYDTQFGSTEKIARAVAGGLQAYGEVQALHVSLCQGLDLRGVDLLVFGTPILAWKPSEPMQAFLNRILPGWLSGVAAACFDTRVRMPRFLTGSAVDIMESQLKSKGVTRLLPSRYFLVKGRQGPLFNGEVEKAAAWAKELAGMGR